MLTPYDAWKLQHPAWYDGNDPDEIDGLDALDDVDDVDDLPDYVEITTGPNGTTVRPIEPDEWAAMYETDEDIPW